MYDLSRGEASLRKGATSSKAEFYSIFVLDKKWYKCGTDKNGQVRSAAARRTSQHTRSVCGLQIGDDSVRNINDSEAE